ncbi:hypothetical protein J7K44_00615, partial [bacterium]|nr:hypothetical protein [bacterium]
MFNIISKFIFYIKKPKIVIVVGKGRACGAEAIFQVLKTKFKTKKISDGNFPLSSFFQNELLIVESNLSTSKERKNLSYFLKNSRLPVLVVTHVGEIPPEEDFFAGELEDIKEIGKTVESLPNIGYLILNFDDETVRELKNKTSVRAFTFGLQERADFRASNININYGVNFKINYKGNVVPCWLEKLFGKEQIYTALAATAVGVVFGLNLVEISQALKNYKSLPGKMRLIEGIKGSQILDDSESATSFS